MTSILWGLLNVVIILWFIKICFYVTKRIREKLGLFASVIFVFLLLSCMSHENKNSVNLDEKESFDFVSGDHLKNIDRYSKSIQIILEDNLVSRYVIIIDYGLHKQLLTNIPIKAFVLNNGLSLGTSWLPLSIAVKDTEDKNKFEYYVKGVVKWKILNTTIYSQFKEFQGIALID